MTPETVIRCEKYACTLTARACALRQADLWRKPGRYTVGSRAGKRFVVTRAKHPFCASGDCARGREVAERIPQLVEMGPRPEKRTAPRLDLVRAAEEETMACSECGSKTCHKAGCPNAPANRGAKPKLPEPPKAAKAPRKVMTDKGSVTVMAIRALDTPSLLLVRQTVERELEERLTQVEGEAARLREAVRSAAARAVDAMPKSEAA